MGAIELLLTQFVEEETRPTLRGAGYVLTRNRPQILPASSALATRVRFLLSRGFDGVRCCSCRPLSM